MEETYRATLRVGNTVVVKPASDTPVRALHCASVIPVTRLIVVEALPVNAGSALTLVGNHWICSWLRLF